MKLAIVSDSHHYVDERGCVYNLAPLVPQFEVWAELFERVVVCAPLLAGPPPRSHVPYTSKNIELLPIATGGGNTVFSKLALLCRLPGWVKALHSLYTQVDAVHIRTPNNISIPGLIMLEKTKLLRQSLFTGTWNGYPGEPLTYKWQRRYLASRFSGPVAVYGVWPGQPGHVVSSFSPSYTHAHWVQQSLLVQQRLAKLRFGGKTPTLNLLTVGSLVANKNQAVAIRALSLLRAEGLKARLVLAGEGPERKGLEELAAALSLSDAVHFEGWADRDRLSALYRDADFVLQAPLVEGYGKVPIEAFFHGAIPVLSNVGISEALLGGDERGRCFMSNNATAAAAAILDLHEKPQDAARCIERAREYALTQTIDAWKIHLECMLREHWGVA